MFNYSQFNQPIGNWNVSSVTDMFAMFASSQFNQPLSSWNVSNVQDMGSMFSFSQYDQDLGSWNIRNVVSFAGFMAGKDPSTLSSSNLDSIYNGWSTSSPQTGLNIDFGSANYTTAGQAGRDILTGTYGWTITDGGPI
jgi:surface protein